MIRRRLRIGTRGSALARWQSDFVAAELTRLAPDLCIEVVEISSTGDQITDQPLWQVEGTGFFTATIERALLDGEVDIAVHSYKDLPVDSTDGLVVAAVPPRGAVEDVLCARDGMTVATLPSGARIGTCSARRTAQVRAMRPDLDFRPLRGNVPTRIGRVKSGDLDAIVLARAGIERLGLDAHISEIFSLDRVLPAPAQGALAIQCRAADHWIVETLAPLDDHAARQRVDAERTVLHALGGGCSVPVGAVAIVDGDRLTLAAGVFSMDPCQSALAVMHGVDARVVGEAAARRLLKRGAGAILEAFDKTARIDLPVPNGGIR
jgi:hydroxymethylbilane synthase